MKFENLRELYIKELQDLYDAESQIIKALPKLIRASTTGALSGALQDHLEVTKEQVIQLDELFAKFSEKAGGKKCKGMEGLLKEAEETLKEDMDPEVKDAAIIAACQRVEHYEMAGYGCVKTYAHLLGDEQSAATLERILSQEKQADQKLTALAEEINVEAVHGASGQSSYQSSRPGSSSFGSSSSRSQAGSASPMKASPADPDRDQS
jgi:ferritin-like metal-binding protein YciE